MIECNKESILQRIRELQQNSTMSKSAFAEFIGMEQTTLNNQFLGKRGVSIDLITNIIRSFDDISSEWLLRGKGPMLLSETITEQDIIPDSNIERMNRLVDTITTLQGTINEQMKTIKSFEEKTKRLEAELARIKNERKIG